MRKAKHYTIAIRRKGVWKPWYFSLDIGPGRWTLDGRAWTKEEAIAAAHEYARPFMMMGFTEVERR